MDKEKSLTFITGNSGKLAEVQAFLPFVAGKSLELPEIQETDLQKVVEAKLKAAAALHEGPVIVDDTALYLECFGAQNGQDGLPGPLIKWFLKTITNVGLAKIAQRLGKTKAYACTTIGFHYRGRAYFFQGVVQGSVVAPQGTAGFGWDHIFVPQGQNQTFASMGLQEKNKISPRAIAVQKLQAFLEAEENQKGC